jgi:hypothetical protein
VRTYDDLGAPLANAAYDPWGVPQARLVTFQTKVVGLRS